MQNALAWLYERAVKREWGTEWEMVERWSHCAMTRDLMVRDLLHRETARDYLHPRHSHLIRRLD
jgi:hypothetical protein